MDRTAEIARFNGLSQDDAAQLLKTMEDQEPAVRSCWYCNEAHKHLMDADYPILCIMGCGGWYLHGFPAFVVVLRSEGESVTEQNMDNFEKYLDLDAREDPCR